MLDTAPYRVILFIFENIGFFNAKEQARAHNFNDKF